MVLAAGSSSRMGRPKQLLHVDGESMIVRAVKIAWQSTATEVVVITGAYREEVEGEVRQGLAWLLSQEPNRVRLVHNPKWEDGQASSIHAAIQALDSSVEAAIFMPADQPFVEPSLLRLLQRRRQMGHDLVAPLVDGEIRGAPALFDRQTWPELLSLHGDTGGRLVLRRHANGVATVSAVASTLRDIDTPGDHLQG